jgi:DNA polymerase-3 subunit epsilon
VRILGIDTETTGLDDKTDRIIEVGCCLWDWESKIPLAIYSSLVIPERDIPEEITALTGITAGQINEFGWPEEAVLGQVDELLIKADYIMAHNAPFDKGFFDKGIERQQIVPRNIPWLDSLMDIVFLKTVATRNLNYLAAESGFVNPWKHRAIFDVMTMLKLASDYDIEAIIARSKEPILYVQAIVSFEEKELAKERGYHWHGQSKRWWRSWKQSDYEADKFECPFRTQLLPGALE